MEQKCDENEQYSRRECLEISGIPGSINDNALEETVFNLFSNFHAPFDPSNVEDCLQIKSTKMLLRKVILKLLQSKDVYQVLKANPGFKAWP